MDLESRAQLGPLLEPGVPEWSGCFTSQVFDFFVERQLAEAQRYGNYSALLLFRVGDNNGSSRGEGDVQTLTGALRRNIRESDLLGLIDDKTVGVMLLHTHLESVGEVVTRLKEEVLLHLGPDRSPAPLEVSSACYPTEANTTDELWSLAQTRLEECVN